MRGLILCDVDKTIQDHLGFVNAVALFAQIAEMIEKGWVIGVNSDTSRKRLVTIMERFGFNGPMISERGQIVSIGKKAPIIFDAKMNKVFTEMEQSLVFLLMSKFGEKAIVSPVYDYPEDSSTVEKVDKKVYPHIVCYFTRECSFSFSVLNDYQGQDPIDNEFFIRFVDALQEFLDKKEKNELAVEYYSKSSFVQIISKTAYKGSPVEMLLKHYGQDRLFMIGDCRFDDLKNDKVVQCAVGNADDDYKRRCAFVAEDETAAGAFQCLQWIDENF
jgi:hydroxymethylpyrimidine pyrophosphatase-like HAD family hydrolase